MDMQYRREWMHCQCHFTACSIYQYSREEGDEGQKVQHGLHRRLTLLMHVDEYCCIRGDTL